MLGAGVEGRGRRETPSVAEDVAQVFTGKEMFHTEVNKYAIYAYTHGPVAGSGPSVKPLKYDVAPYWLS